MGQGLYDLLGWGLLCPPYLDEETHGAAYDAVHNLGLQTAYETEPDYLVIPLAVSDEVLQEWWHLPGLPDACPRVQSRTARAITLPPETVTRLAHESRTDLQTTWRAAQRLYAEAGLVLGAPSLILLNDWD